MSYKLPLTIKGVVMNSTMHAQERMSQRGISRAMVEYVIEHGTPECDRVILGRKEALQMLEDLREQQRILTKILDKGGVVVVAAGDKVITTYNCQRRNH
ncbi:hypothetical protein GSUET_14980 [Geobacter sulfurreducens subsp. ethanolicus]|nr:hypothetical protein GSUET_14980 [Geobacter sulfurreducens subsp. ethanolicus]